MILLRHFLPTKIQAFFALALGSLFCVAVFQNCSPLKPSDSAAQDQASYEDRNASDQAVLAKLTANNSIKVWISARESAVEASGGNATGISSLMDSGLRLASEGAGPAVAQDGFASVLTFSAAENLKSAIGEAKMAADRYSIVALMDSGPGGKLISISVSPDTHEFAIQSDGTHIKAAHVTSAGNLASVEQAAPAGVSTFVVAASFGLDANEILLQLQGVPVQVEATVTGNPIGSTYSNRRLILGATSGSTSMKLRELIVVTEVLSQHELNSLSRLIAGKWGITSLPYVP